MLGKIFSTPTDTTCILCTSTGHTDTDTLLKIQATNVQESMTMPMFSGMTFLMAIIFTLAGVAVTPIQ